MQDYIVIHQGDQGFIPFPIILNGHIITEDFIKSLREENSGDVEITIDKLTKSLQKGEIKFNTITYTFDFPLSQEETFKFFSGTRLKSQIRVKFSSFDKNQNNFIYSYNGPDIVVLESMSKVSI